MKKCTCCGEEKPLSAFYRSKSKKSGYKSHCKSCVSDQRKDYYKSPEGYKKKIEKSWRDKGMVFTIEEYGTLLENQNYGCGICGAKSNRNGSRLCVDHCHTTGKIRGLLCHECNTSLGKFNDDVSLLAKAITYLEKHK